MPLHHLWGLDLTNDRVIPLFDLSEQDGRDVASIKVEINRLFLRFCWTATDLEGQL